MKKTKQGWELKRAKTTSSASFVKLFEKARAAMAAPKSKACVHRHPICAANAHVGDLKRTGKYTCDQCNRIAQGRYLKSLSK